MREKLISNYMDYSNCYGNKILEVNSIFATEDSENVFLSPKKSVLKNTGFSLIELSIVLIIIGLLVAGVTGGASLIQSAKIRAKIMELNDFKVSVNAYYSENGYLPGTSSGESRYILTCSDSGSVSRPNAWKDMYDAGLSNFKPTQNNIICAGDGCGIDANIIVGETVPFSKSKDVGYLLRSAGGISGGNPLNSYHQYFVMTGRKNLLAMVSGNDHNDGKEAFTPKEAEMLDKKMDDGLPWTGKLRGGSLGEMGDKCTTGTANSYKTSNEGKYCGAAFLLDI